MVYSSTGRAVVISGVTGTQGSSLANSLLASPHPYRIIGLTRNVSKPAALECKAKGIELRQVSINVGHEEEVKQAMEGAEVFFGVTDFNSHGDKDREIAEGKLMVDCAKSASVKLFLWSSLVSIVNLSSGKYSCAYFDSKAEVTEYLKAQSELGWADVPCGLYCTNFLDSFYMPKKDPATGVYVLELPCPPSTIVPIIDTQRFYGDYVVRVLENSDLGAGSVVLSGYDITLEDLVKELGHVTGKRFAYREVSADDFVKKYSEQGPELGFVAILLSQMYGYFGSVPGGGYYGGRNLRANQDRAGIRAATWSEILEGYKGKIFLE